jgi:hypothetical protein
MADTRTIKMNPRWLSELPAPKKVAAYIGQTWKAGQFGYYYATRGAYVATTSATKIHFVFAQDQTVATTASELVWVYEIPAKARFEMYVCTTGSDNADTVAYTQENIGTALGIFVGSNLVTLDTAQTSNVAFTVRDTEDRYSPITYKAANPTKVIAEINESYRE